MANLKRFIADAVETLPADYTSPSEGYTFDGNPATGTSSTAIGQEFYNQTIDESNNLIIGAGLTPDHTDRSQWLKAVRAIASFPAGTTMVFADRNPPPSWTKLTGTDSAGFKFGVLELVDDNTGGQVAGTVTSTQMFASNLNSVGSTVLTAAQIPSHRHLMVKYRQASEPNHPIGGGFVALDANSTILSRSYSVDHLHDFGDSAYALQPDNINAGNINREPDAGRTGAAGGGQGHTHSLSLNLDVRRIRAILARRNA